VEEALPRVRRRAVPAWTARLVAEMMTGVTGEGGTGTAAAIEGFLVAGKTGTAQKADYVNGGYAKGKWVSSFVGFVPVRDPELLVVVMIDEPVIAHHGGTVASPVFRRVAESALRNMGVAARGLRPAPEKRVRARRADRRPPAGKGAGEAEEAGRTAAADGDGEQMPRPGADEVLVPDFIGLSARAALVAARDAELLLRLEGSGRVVEQSLQPGRIAKRGARLRAVLRPPSSGGSTAADAESKNEPELSPAADTESKNEAEPSAAAVSKGEKAPEPSPAAVSKGKNAPEPSPGMVARAEGKGGQ
jgi:cell division protein FtsI (penicillin-binding protein 3)